MKHTYNWHNEPLNQTVQVCPNFLANLTLSCINKVQAESQTKKIDHLVKVGLARASLKKWLYRYSEGGIEIKNLVKLCNFLKIPYASINNKFVSIGQMGKKSNMVTLRNPEFPINLNVPEMGTIIGAQTSDASLSSRGWWYYNNKKGSVYKIREAIIKIFGNVQTRIALTNSGQGYVLQAPAFVARCINNLGVPYGDKAKQNYPLPNIVMKGSLEMQKKYLAQRYSDEGSIRFIRDGRKRWQLFCYQAIDLNNFLKADNYEELKNIVIKKGKLKLTPSSTKASIYSKISYLKKFKLEEYKPNFLLNEQKLLEKFGIHSCLNLTKVKYYFTSKKLSAYWQSVVYDQKDIVKFYRLIRFNDSEKNKKLAEFIKQCRHHVDSVHERKYLTCSSSNLSISTPSA